MKKIYESLFLLLFLTSFAMISCDDGGEETVNLKYESRNIQVTGINPPSGYVGETLEILGKDFGVSPEQAKVYIGNTQVNIISYEDTKIVAEVPEQGTRGKVAVEVLGSKVISDLVYDVLGNPGVVSIDPSYGFIGDQITFAGHDFGAVASLVKVRFAGTAEDAEVYKCENEEILVVVPKNAITGPIKLQISKQDINMPYDFTVLAHADFDGISVESGYRKSQIILTGKNFVGGVESIKVFFGKVQAQIVSCTATEIVVTVPDGVEEGENTVSIETPYEKVSMTRTFTVLPTPVINEIDAAEGYVGAVITLTGEKLPAKVDNIVVKFGESRSEVVSCSATELKVKVPAPVVSTDFGKVEMILTISGLQIYSHEFTIKETPVITSIASGKLVKIGSEVIISGERFTATTLQKVTIGGIETPVISVSDTEIKVAVPDGFAGGKIALTFDGIPLNVESDTELIRIDAGQDITDYVLKNYQQPVKGTGSGEWQLPADWEMNKMVKDAVVGMQNGVIAFQRGWGKSWVLTNAKMWQVAKLPAGKYKLQAVSPASNIIAKDATRNFAYILVAKGSDENAIPNRSEIESSSNCAFNEGGRPEVGDIATTVLELTESSDVVIGFLIQIDADGCYFKVSDMTLTCVE